MTDKKVSAEIVGKSFSEKWWSDKKVHPDVYEDLMGKLQDANYVVKSKPSTIINRALLACNYVIDNVPKGGSVLVMACGIGFNACCLASYGYEVEAFDISDKAIDRAKLLAHRIGKDPSMFSVSDVSSIAKMEAESFDAVLAIGLFRYLDKQTQDMCYKNIHRIMKPSGKFLVIHQNLLFEPFAMNNESLQFWANMIESYSDVAKLLEGKSIYKALSEEIKVPKRQYKQHSISHHMETQVENPITYGEVAAKYGFKLEKILYPSGHVLPPFLENRVDQEALDELKKKIYADHVNDWRAMFIEFEFLAFLQKA